MMNKLLLTSIALMTICKSYACDRDVPSSSSFQREPAGIIELKDGVNYWRPVSPPFEGREHAGRILGEQLLKDYGINELKDAVVLGCPRGGVLFAKGVVDMIKMAGGSPTLDLVICRKIPLPGQDDYGVGAITEQGSAIYIDYLMERFGLDPQSDGMLSIEEKVRKEVERRIKAYRQDQPFVSLTDKVVVIVDGVVNGGTMLACIESVRAHSMGTTRRIIVGTPVTSRKGKSAVLTLGNLPEEDYCAAITITAPPGSNWNSDDFYQKTKAFEQMTDQEVRDIIKSSRQ